MLTERKWRPEGAARTILGIIVTAFCLLLLASTLRQLTGEMSSENRSLLDLILGTVIFQGSAMVWIFIFLREEKLSFRDAFGFHGGKYRRAILFGILTGVSIVPIAWTLQMVSVQVLEWLQWNPQSQELVQTFQQTTKEASTTGILNQRIAFGVSVILLAPIAEEILFRGLIYPTIKNLGFPKVGLWISAIVFALMHQNMAGMIPFIFLGIVLVLVYEETDSLLAPILTHSIFNTANFLFMLYQVPINKFLFRQ